MADDKQKKQFEEYHKDLLAELIQLTEKETSKTTKEKRRNWRKQKATWDDQGFVFVEPEENLFRVDDDSDLAEGQFWVACKFHGDRLGYRWPEELPKEVFSSPHPAADAWENPWNYLTRLIEEFRTKEDQRTFQGRGDKVSKITSSREAARLIKEQGGGYGVTPWHADSARAGNHLEQALARIADVGGEPVPEELARALLFAYDAGISAAKAEGWDSRERARSGFEWEEGKGRSDGAGNKLKGWQKRAIELWKKNPKLGPADIVSTLDDEGFISWGGKGAIFKGDSQVGVKDPAQKIKNFRKTAKENGLI